MKFAQAIFVALIGGAALAAAAPTVATAEAGEQAPLTAPKAAPKAEKAGQGLKAGVNSVVNPQHQHHHQHHRKVKGQRTHSQRPTQHGHSRHSQKTGQGSGRQTGTNQREVATHPVNTALHKKPAQPALTAREYMDEIELFVRALEEELDARDYFDDELDARDFEDELDAREFDYELDARDIEDELDARGIRSWLKNKFGGNRNADPNAGAPTDVSARDVENDLEARGSGQHHCPVPGCGSLKQRCIKKGHVEICDTHQTPHIPGDKCVSCQAAEDAAARKAAQAKKSGKK